MGKSLALFGNESELRDNMASLLAGLDAKQVEFKEDAASALAFDPTGQRLLIGGYPGKGTRVRNLKTGDVRRSSQSQVGPVGWRGDVPVHLVRPTWKRPTFLLWNVDRNVPLDEFTIRNEENTAKFLDVCLSADTSHMAALVRRSDHDRAIIIWRSGAKAPVKTIELPPTENPDFGDAIALSSDGSLFALGSSSGRVSAWNLSQARPEPITFDFGRSRVTSLAFARHRDVTDPDRMKANGIPGWLLGAGNAGGKLAVWDLGSFERVMVSRESHNEILALAFSADAQAVFSTGRVECRLWDLNSGLQKLRIEVERNVIPALAVSPSGSQLALGSIPIYDPRCGVDLFEMQAHRGIQTLRGLTGQVCRTTITRNGNWIAAITLDSQAGVWNVFTGELMLRIDVPEALFAAHADVRVTEDGQFLIIASGKAAQRWSIPQVGPNQSPRLVDTWPLNPAFTNRLVISPEGKLLLCRFETKSGKQYPLGLASIDSDPRRVRIYELVPSKPALLIAAHADLPEHVDAIVALPDATCFIADGVASKMPVLNLVVAYAAQSKDRLWELPLPENRLRGSINIDATGRVLCYCVNSNLYQLRSLPFQAQPDVPGGAKEWPAFANRVVFRFAEDGVRLGFPESASEFLTLSPGKKVPGNTSLFTPDGRYLIWGLEDGTVHVADMEKVRQAMTTVGFGWEKLE